MEGRFRPEGLKLFHNRWYLLGYRNGSEFCAVPLDALTKIYLSGNRFQADCRFSLAKRLSDSIGVVAPTGQQPEEVTLRAYGPFADYLRKHPFHHSQVERNNMEMCIRDRSSVVPMKRSNPWSRLCSYSPRGK